MLQLQLIVANEKKNVLSFSVLLVIYLVVFHSQKKKVVSGLTVCLVQLAVMSNLPSPINFFKTILVQLTSSIFFFNHLGLNYCCAECLLTILLWRMLSDGLMNIETQIHEMCHLQVAFVNRFCCLSIVFGDYTVVGCNG